MAITRTAIAAVTDKASGLSIARPGNSANAGDLIVVCLAYDDATLSSVVWGTQQMTLQSAVIAAGVRVRLAWCIAATTASNTITATWATAIVAKAMTITKYSSSIPGAVAHAGSEVNNTGTGTAASTSASSPIVGGTESILVAVVGTEGPSGDTAGTWVTPSTNGQRAGTTGNPANGNVTVSEGYQIAPTAGSTPALSKTGMTSRDWGAELQAFYWTVSSSQSVVANLLSNSRTVNNPTVSPLSSLLANLLTGSRSLYMPSITGGGGSSETTIFTDTFGRTSSSGWGTSDSGHTWDDTDDTADFTVGSGVGQVNLPNTSSPHNNVVGEGVIDVVDAIGRVKWKLSQRPSSGFVTMIRFYTRRGVDLGDVGDLDADDIRHAIRIRDNGSIELQHDYSIDGIRVDVNSTWFVTGKTYVAGDQWNCRYEVTGASPSITVRTRVWKVGDAEPSTWDLSETFNPSSTGLDHGGTTGIHVQTSVGNTAVPFTVQLDDWTLAQAGVAGGSQSVNPNIAAAVISLYGPIIGTGGLVVQSNLISALTALYGPVISGGASGLTTYAKDLWSGTHATNWNPADIGGSWTIVNGGGTMNEGSGVGSMLPNAGATQRGDLLSVSVLDSDTTVRVRFSETINTASGINPYVEARYVSSSLHYRVRVQFTNTNTVRLQLEMNGTAVTGGSFITVTRETYAPATWFWIRFQVEGTNPTTLRAKVWQDGTTEPADWDLVGTDSTAGVQTAGAPGLRGFTGSLQSPSGTYNWDDLNVTNISSGVVAQTVVGDLLAAALALYQPVVSPGAVSVVAQLLTDLESIYSPTVVPVGPNVVAQLLADSKSIYSPTVIPVARVVANLLADALGINSPAVIQQQFVVAQLLADTLTVFNAVVAARNTIIVGLLADTVTTNSPTISATNRILANLLVDATTVGAAAVAARLSMQLLADSLAINNPAVKPTNLIVSNSIAGNSSVSNPAIAATNRILANLIANGLLVSSPSVTARSTIVAQLLVELLSVNGPSILPGGVTVVLQALADSISVNNPALVPPASTIIAQLLADTKSLFDPRVGPTNRVVVNTLTDSITLNNPSFVLRINTPLLQDVVSADLPVITTSAITVVMNVIANGNALGSPQVVPGGVSIVVQSLVGSSSTKTPAVKSTYSVLTPLLADSVVANNPKIVPGGVSVSAQLLVDQKSLFGPAVAPGGVTVAALLLQNAVAANSFAVKATNRVIVNGLADVVNLTGPDVTSGVTVLVPLIDITPLLNDPSLVVGGVTVLVNGLSDALAVLQPQVAQTSAPGQLVDISGLLDTVNLGQPGVLPGSVKVNADFLSTVPSVYDVGITQEQFVLAQVIAEAVQAYSPDLRSIFNILAGTLQEPVSVFAPESIPGGITVQVGDLVVVSLVGSPRMFIGIIPTNWTWERQAGFTSTRRGGFSTAQNSYRQGKPAFPSTQPGMKRTRR